MTYSESLRYLNSFFNFEKISFLSKTRKLHLARMRFLLRQFGSPEKSFFPILIAGTKGKGSTGIFLENILEQNGIPTGFYSSPHLSSPRERIRIRGRMISVKEWTNHLARIRRKLSRTDLPPELGGLTYFEIMTLLAILVFAEKRIRAGIFEIGMGGRLDATNVMNAKLAVLTPIHFDHEAFLGSTLRKIAFEKAAIIKSRTDVVAAPQKPDVRRVILAQVKKMKAMLHRPAAVSAGTLSLAGDFQRINAGCALRAAEIFVQKQGSCLNPEKTARALRTVRWPGRLETFSGRPSFLLDGAHNPASIAALTGYLKGIQASRRKLVIFAVQRDKKSDTMLQSLSAFFRQIVVLPVASGRTQEVAVLIKQAAAWYERVYPAGDVREAWRLARRLSDPQDLVTVTGSLYLVGEFRNLFLTRRSF